MEVPPFDGAEIEDAAELIGQPFALIEVARVQLTEALVRALGADLPVVIETMNALAREVDDMSLHLRRQLHAFPLWTGEAWSSARPIYAVRYEAFASAIADQGPVWQPAFALDGLESS
jgi:hypothetical protein